MEIQAGKFYVDRTGRLIKAVAVKTEMMRPVTPAFLTDLNAGKVKPLDDDLMRGEKIACVVCWAGGDEPDILHLQATGQVCLFYKLVSGEDVRWAYPASRAEDESDLMREVDPGERVSAFREHFFEVQQHVVVTVRVRARNGDLVYDEFPSESALDDALRPLFASDTVEVQSVEYDYGAGEFEEEYGEDEDEDEEE